MLYKNSKTFEYLLAYLGAIVYRHRFRAFVQNCFLNQWVVHFSHSVHYKSETTIINFSKVKTQV